MSLAKVLLHKVRDFIGAFIQTGRLFKSDIYSKKDIYSKWMFIQKGRLFKNKRLLRRGV